MFAEAIAAHLCVPSPVCRDRVGEKVGRTTVDQFGDRVMSVPLPGDSWRHRHDAVKQEIVRLAHWAGVKVTCEVFNCFSHLIPQAGLNRMERGRARQGILPDFLMELTDPETKISSGRLCELKVINCCPTRYVPGDKKRAVERRADLLPAEYRKKARDCDRQYVGTPDGLQGPVESALLNHEDLFCWVFGRFGEAAPHVHSMVQSLAEARVSSVARATGQQWTEAELGMAVTQIRRNLSVVAVRSQSDCLLSRMMLVGPGVNKAASRRHLAVAQEERMRRDRAVHFLARVTGRQVIRRGRFMGQ